MAEPLVRETQKLYGLPLSQFTAARNARAKTLRKSDPELAAAVAALPKPSVAAGALNELVHEDPSEVRALVQSGKRLRQAQEAAVYRQEGRRPERGDQGAPDCARPRPARPAPAEAERHDGRQGDADTAGGLARSRALAPARARSPARGPDRLRLRPRSRARPCDPCPKPPQEPGAERAKPKVESGPRSVAPGERKPRPRRPSRSNAEPSARCGRRGRLGRGGERPQALAELELGGVLRIEPPQRLDEHRRDGVVPNPVAVCRDHVPGCVLGRGLGQSLPRTPPCTRRSAAPSPRPSGCASSAWSDRRRARRTAPPAPRRRRGGST